MIEEQKDFKDLFDTDNYYVLNKNDDMQLLNKGFIYGFDTMMHMRTLKGYCIINNTNCEIVIGRDMDYYNNVTLFVKVLKDEITRRHVIPDILNATVNDLEKEILNIVKKESE